HVKSKKHNFHIIDQDYHHNNNICYTIYITDNILMAYRRLSMSPGEALQTEIPEARRMENYRSGNCLLNYFDPNTKKFRNFTASQFGDVWNHFDQDVLPAIGVGSLKISIHKISTGDMVRADNKCSSNQSFNSEFKWRLTITDKVP
ncbi:unnamed protein product, partial [Schistosoma curassoni]|uniref:Ricin B-type lectin domain-containing protein n=1 Tax=Schistosoma curassoni TaxID=6186 RepID=A0A183JRC2_9TREM